MRHNMIMAGWITTLPFITNSLYPRSIHRPKITDMPILTANWDGEEDRYSIKNDYLQEYPFFEIFDRDHFFENYLPTEQITFRNKLESSVNGTILAQLIDELIEEINYKKKLRKLKRDQEFRHFTVLRNRNFNRHKKFGLLILKCKDYPFVVKLSIETPQSFTNPYKKGFEPTIFFFMAGGINRHMSGFTRIKNATYVKNCIAQIPDLSIKFDIPRKWFYVPKNSKWINLEGRNIGLKDQIQAKIPGTYCIVADAIECKRTFSLLQKDDRKFSMRICNAVNFYVDPHIDNFMIEKKTNKVVIIDTEHFPSITGFSNINTVYTSQLHWYIDLSVKCFQDMFLRDKSTRKQIQRYGTHHYKL